MNFVTLTMHSPSHASATVDAEVKKRNSRTTESMVVGEVCGERKKKRKAGRGEGGSISLSSTAGVESCESSFSNHEVRPAAITGRGYHSYSPGKLDFRSTIRNGEVRRFITHVTNPTTTISQVVQVISFTVVEVVLGVVVIKFLVYVVVLFLGL